MDDPTHDGYLVQRARDGYLDAFEELVGRHQGRAYALAVRMLEDPHEAQDAVQESFVDAWRGLAKFAGDAAFSTWLYRIVVNRCLMTRRRWRPEPVESVPDVTRSDRLEQQVENRARDEALHRGIQELPADMRAPLVLVTFSGFSYEEAAAILGLNTSTVRGRVARARKALLHHMGGWR